MTLMQFVHFETYTAKHFRQLEFCELDVCKIRRARWWKPISDLNIQENNPQSITKGRPGIAGGEYTVKACVGTVSLKIFSTPSLHVMNVSKFEVFVCSLIAPLIEIFIELKFKIEVIELPTKFRLKKSV